MRFLWIILPAISLSGCATQTTEQLRQPPLRPLAIATVAPTKVIETRYDVRSYREAANPSVRHEAHVVYRSTRVPVSVQEELDSNPRDVFPPASVAPLPKTEELQAELSLQRQLTVELRTMQSALTEMAEKMKAQYALLVRQSAEANKLRDQLEIERIRLKKTGHEAAAANTPVPATQTASTPDTKW